MKIEIIIEASTEELLQSVETNIRFLEWLQKISREEKPKEEKEKEEKENYWG